MVTKQSKKLWMRPDEQSLFEWNCDADTVEIPLDLLDVIVGIERNGRRDDSRKKVRK